jgi:hypothetical protein
VGINDKHKKILKIIILGISIFLIELIVQIIIIFFVSKGAFEHLIGAIFHDLTYLSVHFYFGDTLNIFYSRIIIYLPIWLVTFGFTFSHFKPKNALFRLIIFNLISMVCSTVIFPFSLLYFFTPPFYYLVVSIILTPIIIHTIPFFRNFLKSIIEE